jgi:hypothetical protein
MLKFQINIKKYSLIDQVLDLLLEVTSSNPINFKIIGGLHDH